MINRGDLENRMVGSPPPCQPAELTPRQAEVLAIVERVYAATGEPVSASHLARRLGIFHEAVRGHLATLYRKGYLTRETSPAEPLRKPSSAR